MSRHNIKEILGKTIIDIQEKRGKYSANRIYELVFLLEGGDKYKMYHEQDCCESVDLEDIEGDLKDLLNNPITQAEEVTSTEHPEDKKDIPSDESYTWTFYKLATAKGYVTLRWFGTSNGYYSEEVNFAKYYPKLGRYRYYIID